MYVIMFAVNKKERKKERKIFDFRFTAGVADNGGNLPLVSLTLVANLQR
jgi:hypothetical protein